MKNYPDEDRYHIEGTLRHTKNIYTEIEMCITI